MRLSGGRRLYTVPFGIWIKAIGKTHPTLLLDMLLVFLLCLAVGMIAGNLISKRLGIHTCYEL